jgi:FkbM family methyltransferase
MTDHSQCQEQIYIKEYFGEYIGSFLDVGAADGIRFSNVYQLLLDGWSGLSVEPETKTFRQLIKNYEKFGNRSELALSVINSREGFVTFYENGQLSTTSHEHMANWEAHRKMHNYEWRPILHYAITLDMLLQQNSSRNFDFISVDLEGENISVITSTNWNLAPNCKLVCIEHDNSDQAIIDYMTQYGFEVYKRTPVNILMSRKT